MEEMRKHIVRISRIIQFSIWFCMAIFGIVTVLGFVLAFYPYQERNLAELNTRIVDNANLLPIDLIHMFLKNSHIRLQICFAGICISLMALTVFFLIYELRKIFRNTIKSQTPFTHETCEALKKLSVKALLLVVFSTLAGIIVFLLLRLFAYIFEYGTFLQEKAEETNHIQEEMIMSFAEVVENKSEQTGKHVRRVAEYSRIIALGMGIDEERAERLRLASTMHDIGKLLINDEILEKPARLTDEEFDEIKKHPGYGGKLLKNVEGDVMRMAKTVALEHHERPDGRGYPNGKSAEDISIEGQIVAVSDVYDALTSRRSYKQAWDPQVAYEEIIKGKGTQFGDAVVNAFIRVYPQINAVREQMQG
ncbi:MAG: HD-GYP domain-containing protein [Ruminococcus sp.]|nr:HD-GYP domain-containing protein [Ruminococcus sp.]